MRMYSPATIRKVFAFLNTLYAAKKELRFRAQQGCTPASRDVKQALRYHPPISGLTVRVSSCAGLSAIMAGCLSLTPKLELPPLPVAETHVRHLHSVRLQQSLVRTLSWMHRFATR